MYVTQTSFSTRGAPPSQRAALWSAHCELNSLEAVMRTLGSEQITVDLHRTVFDNFEVREVTANGFLSDRTPEAVARSSFDSLSVGVLLGGRSVLYHPKRIDVLERGDASFYDPNFPCAYGASDGYHEVSFWIQRGYFEDRYGDVYPSEPTVLRSTASQLLAEHAEELLELTRRDLSDDSAAGLEVETKALLLLDEILGQADPSSGYWMSAREYIRRNVGDRDLSVSAVARAVNLGERQLARVFAVQQTSVARVITEERVRAARLLLLDPKNRSLTLAEVASCAGFASVSHFGRTFYRTYGISAHDYRASLEFPA